MGKNLISKRHRIIPAAYLILIKKNQVLLLRRFNTGFEDGNYCLIAGHVDKGETFTECIIREAKEEAGISLNPQNLEVVHAMHRNSSTAQDNERIDVFFSARRWTGEPSNQEPHKCDDLSWFKWSSLPKNIIPYIKQALECAQEKIFYSEHGW